MKIIVRFILVFKCCWYFWF